MQPCFNQMTKSVTCPEELGGLASQVTVDYAQLAHQGRLAAATAEPEEVSSSLSCLKECVRKKLHSLVFLGLWHWNVCIFNEFQWIPHTLMRANVSILRYPSQTSPTIRDQTEKCPPSIHPLSAPTCCSLKAFLNYPEDGCVCKYTTNKHTALIVSCI